MLQRCRYHRDCRYLPADLIGAITIPEDLNGDGILNADELGTDGTFNAQVALGPMQSMAQW